MLGNKIVIQRAPLKLEGVVLTSATLAEIGYVVYCENHRVLTEVAYNQTVITCFAISRVAPVRIIQQKRGNGGYLLNNSGSLVSNGLPIWHLSQSRQHG